MKVEDELFAKLLARGYKPKTARKVVKYYDNLCPISDCWFNGV